jgi:hypothetical protein
MFCQVSAMDLLPLFFRLFRCQDKALRQLLFNFIVSGGNGRACPFLRLAVILSPCRLLKVWGFWGM